MARICSNPECPDRAAKDPVELVDALERCPVCGAGLIDAPRAGEPDRGEGLVFAGTVADATLVEIAKSLLDANGIAHTTRFEALQDLFGWGRLGAGYSVAIGPVELWVQASRLEEVALILSDPAHGADSVHLAENVPELEADPTE